MEGNVFKSGTKRAKFSSFTSPANTSRRSGVNLFGSKSRSSLANRSVSFNRSAQSSFILEETAQHCVESFGTSLPVLIREALTLADRNAQISVSIDSAEWAWLVCGRRLFVWRYRSNQYGKATQCKELTLPASDLNHTAKLVTVLQSPYDQHVTACVAVSPEGIIRYWPSISHEGSFVEISADLKGEECASLINLQPCGCIAATTTSTLIHLSPATSQSSITCRVLTPGQSTLAGFGRRMSSFIFGTASAQAIGAPLHQLLPGETIDGVRRTFYVLSGNFLQKWLIDDRLHEKMLYQCEVEKHMRDSIATSLWMTDAAHLPDLRFWVMDMQPINGGLAVLGAVMNRAASNELHYVIASILTEGDEMPEEVQNCVDIGYSATYHEEQEQELLGYQLLVPELDSTVAFFYNATHTVAVSVYSSTRPADKVDFLSADDRLLGAGSFNGQVVFFSSKHGLVAVKLQQDVSMMEESTVAPEPSRAETSAIGNLMKVDELSQSEDSVSRLKAAIVLSFQNKKQEALNILQETFPISIPAGHNSIVDISIVQMSQDMIDDFPVADPRWAEAIPDDSTSSTNSLIIQHQLQDKLKAHECLLTFLKDTGLWNRMSSVTVREKPMSTEKLLCEHAEKIVASVALRNMHNTHSHVVDAVIRRVLHTRAAGAASSDLTPQDLFYRLVSHIDEFLQCLIDYEEEMLASEISLKELVHLINSCNTLLITLLQDALDYRKNRSYSYAALESPLKQYPDFLPWTSSLGTRGMRSIIKKQFNMTTDKGLLEEQDPQVRSTFFQQQMQLADLQLAGYLQQLDSIRNQDGLPHYGELERKLEQETQNMIMPFMHLEQYERAASLAEKYHEFGILMRICEDTDNDDRLKRYMTQFAEEGFTEFALRWYMEEGKRGKVLKLPLSEHANLGLFFSLEENKYMSWIYDVQFGNLAKAHETLKELALVEQKSLGKKKTLLSLSKLAALGSHDSHALEPSVEEINDQQYLVLNQETLPDGVLDAIGMDPTNMNVMTAQEIIAFYCSEYNDTATEHDFKKALDLLPLVDQEEHEVEELKIQIWCQAIKRDDWSSIGTDDPLETNRDTVFFKTVELVYTEGLDLHQFLPNVDRLLESEELGDLRHNKTFQFLVRAGYEHIMRIVG
ncbi:nuclear pore complex protein Nup133-like [Lineus longissimus]|uniref:nuclear pore complex protein Nup133-like n=1 Tax=Lineus longissimus TaxID=88925 RepID=UPI002B4F1112